MKTSATMSVEINGDGFKGSSGESPIESLIFKTVCALDGFEMGIDELKAFWKMSEPHAGLGSQIIWLLKDFERAARFAHAFAPQCRIDSSNIADPALRTIIACEPATWLTARRLSQQLDRAILISTGGADEFEGGVTIEGSGPHEPPVQLYVIGSFVQASAAAAGVVAAFLTKQPEASVADIQKSLMARASTARGFPSLRRV